MQEMAAKDKKQHLCDNCRHAMHMETLNTYHMDGAKPEKVQFCTVLGLRMDRQVVKCDRVLNAENNGGQ